jgi:hypothetical protein
LENILTVGIPKDIDEISNLLMCEICGWRVTTEEELLIHRRTHWIQIEGLAKILTYI